mgnify:CR=1 FL=1
MSEIDLDLLRSWEGREETREDVISLAPVQMLAATLDRDPAAFSDGDLLPPLYHWLFFPSLTRTSDLARDGHVTIAEDSEVGHGHAIHDLAHDLGSEIDDRGPAVHQIGSEEDPPGRRKKPRHRTRFNRFRLSENRLDHDHVVADRSRNQPLRRHRLFLGEAWQAKKEAEEKDCGEAASHHRPTVTQECDRSPATDKQDRRVKNRRSRR